MAFNVSQPEKEIKRGRVRVREKQTVNGNMKLQTQFLSLSCQHLIRVISHLLDNLRVARGVYAMQALH